MKECKYCRSMYDDNLSVCPNCGGNKVVTVEEKAEETKLHQKEIENRERAIVALESQKKKLLSIVAGVVGVIIFIIAIASYNANKPLSNGMTKDEGEAVLAEGIAYYESGDYEAAIECFVQLPNDSEQYEEAKKMLAKSEDLYVSSVIEKANDYKSKSQHEVALELLENAQTLLPENAELQKAYNNINTTYIALIRNNAIKEADEYAKNNDYENAIKTINSAINKIGQDEELTVIQTTYTNKYRQNVLDEAYKIIKTDGYAAAIQVVNDGLSLLENDAELLDSIQDLKTYAPVQLLDFDFYTGYFPYERISIEGIDEIMYDNVYYTTKPRNYDGYTKYSFSVKLKGEYNTLSGSLIWPYIYRETDPSQTYYFLSFYDDGRLIYSTKACSAANGKVDFDCSISGVQELEVVVISYAQYYQDYKSYITSLTVQK